MLVLGRKENESIIIGDSIRITIVGRSGSSIRLGVEASAGRSGPTRRVAATPAGDRGSRTDGSHRAANGARHLQLRGTCVTRGAYS